MKKHIISLEDYKRLEELEILSDYTSCIDIIARAVAAPSTNLDEDMKYELGAAYLRISIYYLANEDNENYLLMMNKSKSILPNADRLALAAKWLDRTGTNNKVVNNLCAEFFSSVDPSFREQDGISNSYYESMMEIRKKLLGS